MGIRIVVDRDLCQGHGVCESEAPGVFEVNRDHTVDVLDERPDDSLRSRIELAVAYCPTHALSIIETDDDPTDHTDTTDTDTGEDPT